MMNSTINWIIQIQQTNKDNRELVDFFTRGVHKMTPLYRRPMRRRAGWKRTCAREISCDVSEPKLKLLPERDTFAQFWRCQQTHVLLLHWRGVSAKSGCNSGGTRFMNISRQSDEHNMLWKQHPFFILCKYFLCISTFPLFNMLLKLVYF